MTDQADSSGSDGGPPASKDLSAVVAVSLRGVSKKYGNGVSALAALDLDVHRGEFLTLLGPSGCGKSTVLRLIAGLMSPTTGTVTLSPQSASARIGHSVGFVFQEPTLMPWASVFDNVRLPLRLANIPRVEADAKVSGALARVGLSEFANVYPRELSGGMRMRVSIARALVTDPDILLMDEPFAALDEITRFRLNNDLMALWRSLRQTVIFVTHSVFESVYLSQRVVVMTPRPGRISAELCIEAPEPRLEDFRTSAGYAAQCRDVSVTLAMAADLAGSFDVDLRPDSGPDTSSRGIVR
jgi:NitT/TauT family transport system ATP-binding protein